jgi:enoyl-CoA hydratase/carnithine racemase
MDLRAALEEEARVQASLMTAADFREAYAAFVAKRPPKFR